MSTDAYFANLYMDPKVHAPVGQVRNVLLDSRDRDYALYPIANEYRLKLPTTYKNVTHARLITAEIPSSFYVFTAARGATTLRVNSTTVTIPDGNYGIATMTTALKAALETAIAGEEFGVDVDAATLKLKIACTTTPTLALSIDTATDRTEPTNWGLAYNLGFAKNTVYSGTGSITSPGVMSLNPEAYMLLDIEELNKVDEGGIYATNAEYRSFAKIPLNVNSFEYMYFDKQITVNFMNPSIAKLSSLRVRLRFHDGTLVDFNGMDHSFTLELTCTDAR